MYGEVNVRLQVTAFGMFYTQSLCDESHVSKRPTEDI